MSSYGSGSYYSSMRGGNYDDRRYDDRNESRSRFNDNYRDSDLGGRRQSRFSPPSYSGGQRGDRRQDQRSKAVTYPLGHLGQSGSSRYDYDRDDRDIGYSRDRNRSNNHNRSGGMRGGLNINEGPGILGAKPGAQLPSDLSTPLQGLGLGGLSTDSLKAQIAQQQQQLMAMVQTQSILAAVQAQAQVKPRPLLSSGLLPTPSMPPDRRNHMPMRKRKIESQGGNYGKRDRRFNDNRGRNQGGYNNRRGNWTPRQNRRESGGSQQSKTTPRSRNRSTSETREERNKEAEGSKKKVVSDDVTEESLVEDSDREKGKASKKKDTNVETKKENGTGEKKLGTVTNFLGENVEELVKKHFNKVKSKYVCTPCKIICIKEHSFRKHLMGKRHSSTVLENSGKELDMEEWRKFHEPVEVQPEPPTPVEPEPEKVDDINQDPTAAPEQSDEELDFVKYSCSTRKMAVKNGDIITISSITDTSVKITGFTDEKNMCGCEFVKAVAGFNCRLCKTFIRYGKDVTCHIQSKKHQRNYELLVQDHPQYVESQLSRNRELEEILDKKEGENVVLYEVLDDDVRKSRRKRKDSQGCEQTEVTITKFVTEEDKGNHKVPGQEIEATEDETIEESLLQDTDEAYCNMQQTNDGELDHGDLDHRELDHGDLDRRLLDHGGVDHGDLDHWDQDNGDLDHGTAEEVLERENLLLIEDQEDKEDMETSALSNNEVCATPEPKLQSDDEEEMPLVTSPDVSDLPLGISRSDRDSLSPEKLAPPVTPGRTEAVKAQVNTESDSQDEKVTPSPSRRGGKRGGRGGRTGGRGRGRGKGTRRSARTAAPRATIETKKVTVKEEERTTDVDTEDVDFMDGFEVIDEIAEDD